MIEKWNKNGLGAKFDLQQFRRYLKALFFVWVMVTAICYLRDVIG
jgi:hypothetical protein